MPANLTLESINELFNNELQTLTSENANSKIFNLGKPSAIVLSAGIENKVYKLYGNKLLAKMKKHGFNTSDIKDLPKALSNPIAVFKGSISGSFAILTELNIHGDRVLVSLNIGKGTDVDFNIISSTYGKSNDGVVGWINGGRLLYANTEKALNYLRIPAPIAGAQNNSALTSATKVIQNFQNPKLPEEKAEKNIKTMPSAALKQAIDKIKNSQQAKNQINNMKKTLTIALLLASAVCGAQPHFPKNYNVDLGGGINDAGNYTPSDTLHISISHVESNMVGQEYEGR